MKEHNHSSEKNATHREHKMSHKGHRMDRGHTNAHHDHHAHMVADFKRRFWISLVITIPILLLSPIIQGFLGLREALGFPGQLYLLFALSSTVGIRFLREYLMS